jgi:hypothetical protein
MIEFDALLRDLWRGCGYGALDVDWARGERGFLPGAPRGEPDARHRS